MTDHNVHECPACEHRPTTLVAEDDGGGLSKRECPRCGCTYHYDPVEAGVLVTDGGVEWQTTISCSSCDYERPTTERNPTLASVCPECGEPTLGYESDRVATDGGYSTLTVNPERCPECGSSLVDGECKNERCEWARGD